MGFLEFGRNLEYILELQRGCPFETLVCALKSGTCLGIGTTEESSSPIFLMMYSAYKLNK